MKKLQTVPERDTQHFDDIWRREFNTRPWRYDVTRHTEMARFVRPSMMVVDLAAGIYGTGQFILEELKIKNVIVIGVDISPHAKEEVHRICPTMYYFVRKLPDIGFGDGTFDVVLATQILENMENPQELINQMFRVCKPGGWVSYSTVDMTEEGPRNHGPWPNQIWAFDREDLTTMAKVANGRGKIIYKKLGHYHFVHGQKG